MDNSLHPVKIDSGIVQEAYEAFAALQKAVRTDPKLAENAYFQALLDTGYARFLLALEAME